MKQFIESSQQKDIRPKYDYQIKLQEKCVKDAYVNIVTCGECGFVFLHETMPIEEQENTMLECPHCDTPQDFCDAPDLFCRGMY